MEGAERGRIALEWESELWSAAEAASKSYFTDFIMGANLCTERDLVKFINFYSKDKFWRIITGVFNREVCQKRKKFLARHGLEKTDTAVSTWDVRMRMFHISDVADEVMGLIGRMEDEKERDLCHRSAIKEVEKLLERVRGAKA